MLMDILFLETIYRGAQVVSNSNSRIHSADYFIISVFWEAKINKLNAGLSR